MCANTLACQCAAWHKLISHWVGWAGNSRVLQAGNKHAHYGAGGGDGDGVGASAGDVRSID